MVQASIDERSGWAAKTRILSDVRMERVYAGMGEHCCRAEQVRNSPNNPELLLQAY